MHFIHSVIFTADYESIGKIDNSSLSDQTRIELLVAAFLEKSQFTDIDGNVSDVSNIGSIGCNENEDVETLDFFYKHFGGTLEMRWLPPLLKRVDLIGNDFYGTFETALVPVDARFVRFACNKLIGTIEPTNLPIHIQYFDVSSNLFSGTLDFNNLPSQLEALNISNNNFEGTIDLQKITKALYLFTNRYNYKFWQGITIPKARDRFYIDVSANSFCGNVKVSNVLTVDRKAIFGKTNLTHIVDVNGGMIELNV